MKICGQPFQTKMTLYIMVQVHVDGEHALFAPLSIYATYDLKAFWIPLAEVRETFWCKNHSFSKFEIF